MKKNLLIFLFVLLLSLSACTNTDNDHQEQPEENEKIVLPETLKDAVTTYQSKLNTIIDNDQETLSGQNILTRFYNDTPYDPDDML
jgi:thioredoxin-related protein